MKKKSRYCNLKPKADSLYCVEHLKVADGKYFETKVKSHRFTFIYF